MSEDISKEPLRPSRAEPPQGDADYPDAGFEDEPPYPQTVVTAGVLWIVFGCMILLNMVVILLLTFVVAANVRGPVGEGAVGALVCAGVIGGLFGAVFLHVGNQSVRGTARDTLGNGVGSILFALLAFGGTAVQAVAAQYVQAGINGLGAALLFVAGVLALVGRADYKRWRQVQKARKDRETADRKERRRFIQ